MKTAAMKSPKPTVYATASPVKFQKKRRVKTLRATKKGKPFNAGGALYMLWLER
jgi:hypothetical protein